MVGINVHSVSVDWKSKSDRVLGENLKQNSKEMIKSVNVFLHGLETGKQVPVQLHHKIGGHSK